LGQKPFGRAKEGQKKKKKTTTRAFPTGKKVGGVGFNSLPDKMFRGAFGEKRTCGGQQVAESRSSPETKKFRVGKSK